MKNIHAIIFTIIMVLFSLIAIFNTTFITHPKTGDIWRYTQTKSDNPYRKSEPTDNDYLVLDTKDGYVLYLNLKYKTIESSSEQMFTFNSEKIKTIIK